MGLTNTLTGTRIDEVAAGIYRISTPFREIPGGFSFNQYLLVDEQPLLFHTGPRAMHPLVMEAIASVTDVTSLAFIGFSHYESDECGSLEAFLGVAPNAVPLCGRINAMINVTAQPDSSGMRGRPSKTDWRAASREMLCFLRVAM